MTSVQSDNTSTPFVSTIAVGDARATAITHGVLYWAPELTVDEPSWRAAMPEADSQGRIPCELTTVVVELGDAVVMIDPGPDDPGTAWSAHFQEEWPGSRRTPGLDAALHVMGRAHDDITHVIISHAHFDHFAAVTHEHNGSQTPRFPCARYLLMQDEWDANPEREHSTSDVAVRLGAINQAGSLQLVQGVTDVSLGVQLIPAPGETTGHMAVRVESADQVLWVLGDLAHHACEIAHPDWVPAGRDQSSMLDSRRSIYADAAAPNAIVVFTHERFPPWGRIVREDDGYRWERLPAISRSTP